MIDSSWGNTSCSSSLPSAERQKRFQGPRFSDPYTMRPSGDQIGVIVRTPLVSRLDVPRSRSKTHTSPPLLAASWRPSGEIFRRSIRRSNEPGSSSSSPARFSKTISPPSSPATPAGK